MSRRPGAVGVAASPWQRRNSSLRALLVWAWLLALLAMLRVSEAAAGIKDNSTATGRTGLAATLATTKARNLSNSISPLRASRGGWPLGVLSPVTPSWLSGSWGPWSPWSDCSRPCGTGVAVQTRECRRRSRSHDRDAREPRKKHRKRSDRAKNETDVRRKKSRGISTQCVGQYKRVHVCNEQECPHGNRDFRALQCESFNKQNFSGNFYQWEPFLNAPDPCQLNCRAKGFRFYATLNQSAADGTPCRPRDPERDQQLRWLCVTGICQRVGCDGVVGSSARLDACGVCGGDNATCRAVSGILTRPQLPPGLNVVAVLPQGACNVSVAQLRPTRNLLSLRRLGGSPLWPGLGLGPGPGTLDAAGTRFTHSPADRLRGLGESLAAPGPLNEPLELLLMYQQPNPGIKYEYALPTLASVRPGELGAAGAPPTALAPPLGLATTAAPSRAPARDRDGESTDNEVLDEGRDREAALEAARFPFGQDVLGIDAETRPPPDAATPARGKARRYVWRVTGLSDCSKSCGGGTQQAVVQCVRDNSLLPVSEKRCHGQERPASYAVRCGTRPCPAQWSLGEWSGCSVTCGTGTQTREQSCRQEISSTLAVRVADGACLAPKPEEATIQACRLPPCHHHHHGHHHHHAVHVTHPRPALPPQRDLQSGAATTPVPPTVTPTPRAAWTVGPWSQCSAECGRGLRSRSVSCPAGAVCSPGEQPAEQEACDAGPCGASSSSSTSSAASFWLASEWSTHCSAECGTGVQSRSVVCSAGPGSERGGAAACDARLRPAHTRACSAEAADGACRGQWFAAPWGPCSATCGQGVQTRGVACVQWQRGEGRYQVRDDDFCEARQRPETQQPCAERACPAHWYAAEWSECSRSCGTGAQKREVRCVGAMGPSSACPEDTKLPTRKPCHLQDCGGSPRATVPAPLPPETQDDPADSGFVCEDRLRNCHLVVQARLCKYSYYGTSCCNSCRRKGE